jgi:outer membrane immunogenic protein
MSDFIGGGVMTGRALGYLAIAGLAAVFASPAAAADMPAKAPVFKAPPAVVAYNWTGHYYGSSLGIGRWNIDGSYVLPPPDRHDTSTSVIFYGSHFGTQYQWQNWVVGIEGGYFSNMLDDDYGQSTSPSGDCIQSTGNRRCEGRINDVWTAGVRFGWAADRWLAFASGGYANGEIETRTLNASSGVLRDITSERHGGWYAGVGIEYFLFTGWFADIILGIEYQHIDLGSVRHFDGSGALNINTRDVEATTDIIRLRLISKFTPGGKFTWGGLWK